MDAATLVVASPQALEKKIDRLLDTHGAVEVRAAELSSGRSPSSPKTIFSPRGGIPSPPNRRCIEAGRSAAAVEYEQHTRQCAALDNPGVVRC